MGVVIMSIGAILQACAFSVSQMIVARLITGGLHLIFKSLSLFLTVIRGWQWVAYFYPVKSTVLIILYSINTATAPVWQSETSKPTWRGKLVVFEMMYVAKDTSMQVATSNSTTA